MHPFERLEYLTTAVIRAAKRGSLAQGGKK